MDALIHELSVTTVILLLILLLDTCLYKAFLKNEWQCTDIGVPVLILINMSNGKTLLKRFFQLKILTYKLLSFLVTWTLIKDSFCLIFFQFLQNETVITLALCGYRNKFIIFLLWCTMLMSDVKRTSMDE